ncbi:type IV pilus secretin PilQ [Kushneria indalinina]|uniref:Type IV pilus assembly protein PilQ n=1 Tax=Kushneria indalinina DSM 14324 TaxID=1122140 RepID=A0A3D9DTP6_9GAMM|nr:type IV pilus secretin PilQ [Kushneria indalinina]REC94126.1 type IV pilus assembly protein PilQ [Kushneria indalinina DSM 14324]
MTPKGHHLYRRQLSSGLRLVTGLMCRRSRRHVTALVSGLLLFLTASLASAASLTDISRQPAGQGQEVVRLTFDGAINVPQSTMLSAPQRLVLDFDGVGSRLSAPRVPLAGTSVDEAEARVSGNQLRVIFAMARPVGWQLSARGNVLEVRLGEGGQGGSAGQGGDLLQRIAAVQAGGAVSRSYDNSGTAAVSDARARIEDIDYRAAGQGAGELIVTLDRQGISPQLDVQGSQARVRLSGVRLTPQWQRIVDVSDFATPVSRITPSQSGEDVVLTLALQPGAVAMATQRGSEAVIRVSPADSAAADRQQLQFPFDGKRISLNFEDIDVRTVLSILADEVGLNLVVSDSVSGNVTINLRQVPWDQALDLILQTRGLASRRSGDVLLVAPGEELAGMAQRVAQADQSLSANEALTTDYLQMRYAKAINMAALLRGDQGLGLLSERGHVSVDERTNTLLVQDTRERIEQIRRTIDHLDVPVRQVQIEARIVIARDRVVNQLGVRWGLSRPGTPSSGINLSGASSGIAANGGLSVDLGNAVAPTTGFSFGYLSGDVLLDLELNALESEGKSQTISQPKVITANQHPALIKQGQEIPYQQGGDNTLTGTTVQFKEAVLSLEVTPQITPDNRIIMDLIVNNDDVSSSQYNGVPAIDTNQIQTQVLVNDGETVVLGGILSTEQVNNLYKTPFLGDLPGLGRLFRYTEQSNEKVELLVFITPRILEDTLTVR